MKPNSPSVTACVILVASCAAWVCGIAVALVAVFDLAPEAGWTIASLLGFAMIVWVSILLHEMRHAIDLTEDVILTSESADVVRPLKWTPRGGFQTTHHPC